MTRIDVLPDDVLLEIFDFYVDVSSSCGGKRGIEAWQTLVHVCRRWRSLVLGSSRRLNLRLYCAPVTPATYKLDVWPALPLVVAGGGILLSLAGTDNLIAALKQSDRVCQVDLGLTSLELEKVLATMQVPFPKLTKLRLSLDAFGVLSDIPPIPDSFLGGSAPHLRYFNLHGIPFLGLPRLLLSATHLVDLRLSDIPHFAYISPEAMVALLSSMSSLETFSLDFRSLQFHPGLRSRSPPSPKCSILPALRRLGFKGPIDYLEELVTSIDTPQLDYMRIIFFDQINFFCPRLAQFINRTPTLGGRDEAYVQFGDHITSIELLARAGILDVGISWRESYRQLLSVAQVCNSSLRLPSMVEDLYIERQHSIRVCNIAFKDTQWLQLLLPFTAVKNLYLSEEFAPGIAAALQELVGIRITEVLPSLQNILVEGLEPSGPFQKNIEQFVTARQRSGHPVAISFWRKDL